MHQLPEDRDRLILENANLSKEAHVLRQEKHVHQRLTDGLQQEQQSMLQEVEALALAGCKAASDNLLQERYQVLKEKAGLFELQQSLQGIAAQAAQLNAHASAEFARKPDDLLVEERDNLLKERTALLQEQQSLLRGIKIQADQLKSQALAESAKKPDELLQETDDLLQERHNLLQKQQSLLWGIKTQADELKFQAVANPAKTRDDQFQEGCELQHQTGEALRERNWHWLLEDRDRLLLNNARLSKQADDLLLEKDRLVSDLLQEQQGLCRVIEAHPDKLHGQSLAVHDAQGSGQISQPEQVLQAVQPDQRAHAFADAAALQVDSSAEMCMQVPDQQSHDATPAAAPQGDGRVTSPGGGTCTSMQVPDQQPHEGRTTAFAPENHSTSTSTQLAGSSAGHHLPKAGHSGLGRDPLPSCRPQAEDLGVRLLGSTLSIRTWAGLSDIARFSGRDPISDSDSYAVLQGSDGATLADDFYAAVQEPSANKWEHSMRLRDEAHSAWTEFEHLARKAFSSGSYETAQETILFMKRRCQEAWTLKKEWQMWKAYSLLFEEAAFQWKGGGFAFEEAIGEALLEHSFISAADEKGIGVEVDAFVDRMAPVAIPPLCEPLNFETIEAGHTSQEYPPGFKSLLWRVQDSNSGAKTVFRVMESSILAGSDWDAEAGKAWLKEALTSVSLLTRHMSEVKQNKVYQHQKMIYSFSSDWVRRRTTASTRLGESPSIS